MDALQNFTHQNLRGRSFKRQDLTGANFSNADIRGADFTYANLTGANFTATQAGQQPHWIVIILVSLLLLALLSGLISGYAGGLVSRLILTVDQSADFDQPIFFVISGCVSLIVLAGFAWTVVRKGLGAAFGGLALIIAGIIATAAVVGSAESEAIVGTLLQLLVFASAIAGAITSSIVLSTGLIILELKALILIALIFLIGAIPGALEAAQLDEVPDALKVVALLIAGVVAIGMLGLSLHVSWEAVARKDDRYLTIHKMSIILASFKGTQFRHAILTDSDFTEATLKSADLRTAILKRTCWFHAKQLHCARLEGTYLDNVAIRHLVVTKEGQNQNYDDFNLREVNLQNARLSDISLIGTDLSESILRNADLSRAKLVKTQLYGADLMCTCLTGAFIQDWAIATDTHLDNVRCEYIYMRLPTPDNPDAWRKPDNREEIFQEGDFSDFIAPIVKTLDLYRHQNVDPRRMASTFKTLDLYHYQGIDPGAAAVALKQVAEQYPEASLEVVALEGRGDEKVRLQAVVADDVNQSQLSAEYSERYRQISALPYRDIQTLLAGMAEKDERIRSLERMVVSAIQENKFYIETYYNMGDTVSEKSSVNIQAGGDISNVSGVVSGDVSGVLNLGTISGNVTNAINQLPDQLNAEQPSLKELLTQLQTLIETEQDLPNEDKAEALEQVKTLAETGQKPEDSGLKKAAKTAMKILKGTVSGLAETTKLVVEGTGLLKAIAALLALI